MKKQTVQIQIDEPCSASWTSMNPQGSGCRFCASCEKNVHDLSDKSDGAILRLLEKSPEGICGRLRPDQLGRALMGPQETKSFVSWSRVAAAVLFFFSAEKAAAQGNIRIAHHQADSIHATQTDCFDGEVTRPPAASVKDVDAFVFSGQVLNPERKPLSFVVLEVLQGGPKTITDSFGKFEMLLKTGSGKTSQLITISKDGYESRTIKVNPPEPGPQRIVLLPADETTERYRHMIMGKIRPVSKLPKQKKS
jgi:hypothetical protein